MIQARAHLGHGRFQLEVDGHEEHAAEGAVCAAVSAITQAAVIALAELARLRPDLIAIDITEE